MKFTASWEKEVGEMIVGCYCVAIIGKISRLLAFEGSSVGKSIISIVDPVFWNSLKFGRNSN
jgi:hypothetical protein